MRAIVLRNRLAAAARAVGRVLWALVPAMHDVVGAAGLGLLGWGLWEWSQPLAKVVVGGLLLAVALLRARAVNAKLAGQAPGEEEAS